MKTSPSALILPLAVAVAAPGVMARTADLPDSWLVLYNLNDPDSVAWKDWYIQQWSIPAGNTLGLDVPSDERIQRDVFHEKIFYPVRDHLAANTDLEQRIMGILVGYRVPGNFYLDATHPALQGGGGWSVSSNLQDLAHEDWYGWINPHFFLAYSRIETERLTKATLSPQQYMTARIDGPTLADAMALTTRARAISTATGPLTADERLYYDHLEIGAAPGDEWFGLATTVEDPDVTLPAWYFPWQHFDDSVDETPNCAMRFSYYRVTGWHNMPWGGDPPGSRIVGFAFNSWGATTVRSTTDHGGRYVPNALVNGGFAGALGATAEPYVANTPDAGTLMWCLSDGRTLGEAAFHAIPDHNFMWGLVGDPLLRVPHWFADPSVPDPTVDFAAASLSVDEDQGTATVSVTLSEAANHVVTVVCSTSDGTAVAPADYAFVNETVTFEIGEISKPVAMTIVDDSIDEVDETLTLSLSQPTGATIAPGGGTSVVTVLDDDVAAVKITESGGATSVAENGSTDSYTIVLSSMPTDDVTIIVQPDAQLDVGQGPAVSVELTIVPADWAAGVSVTVAAVDDAIDEGNHTGTLSHALTSADPAYDGLSVAAVSVDIADDDSTAPPPAPGGGGAPPGPVEPDADADGVSDASDNCVDIDNADQADGDEDGAGDACDACPDDLSKLEPGLCGCGIVDPADGDADSCGLAPTSVDDPVEEDPQPDPAPDGPSADDPPEPASEPDAEAPVDGGSDSQDDTSEQVAGSDSLQPPAAPACGTGMAVSLSLTGPLLALSSRSWRRRR